jgi:lysophospholipase L1-like esterase
MGTFAAVPSPAGIVLSVSSALSGGSGSGYSYHIFRATSLPLVVTGTPAFTVSSMPYTDTTVTSGTIYYYKLVGVDDAADVAYSAPAGETGVSTSAATGLTVAAEYSSTILNLVYMGDSITAGSTLSVPATQAPPVTCSIFLSGMYGIRNAFYTNEGYSGFTTNSFLPTVNTSNCYSNSVSAMADLEAANAGTEVFSIMLGTNDSAQSVTAAQVGTNLETIIGSLLASFPSAYVVMNEPILYTANQGNGYSETGLGFLSTYYTEYPIVAVYENGLHPGHVLVGETDAAGFFANSYTTEMTAQSGTNGYYFIHPDQQGALNLGRLWANGIYRAIFGEIISPSGRGRTLK